MSAAVELVTCCIGTQWFGIPVRHVQEVLLPHRLARVPLAPPDIVGFLNLRGQIVTVIDVAARLGIERASSIDRIDHAAPLAGMDVVVTDGGELFALLVDDVGDVVLVAADAIEAAPTTLDPRWRDACAGVVRRPHDVVIVLETGRLVGEPALSPQPMCV
jgi:purine-binding chemotaxis protein CheW